MRKHIGLAILLLILTPAHFSRAEPVHLVLLSMTDIHGALEPYMGRVEGRTVSLGGVARMAAVIKRIKRENPGRTLAFSSGDDFMGRFLREFKGRAIFSALSAAGLDAGTLGNHDFDLGGATLAEAILAARAFPAVSSNLRLTPGHHLENRVKNDLTLKAGGLKVGIFGLMTPDLPQISKTGPGVEVDSNMAKVAQAAVNRLRSKGADLVVALTHIGLPLDQELAAQVSGIDVIMGGHTHILIPSGKEILVQGPDGGQTIVVQAGSQGTHLGRLDLQVEDGRITSRTWQAIPMSAEIESDPQVVELIKGFSDQLPKGVILAKTETELDAYTHSVRSRETGWASWVADLLRARGEADVALINSGNFRGNLIIPPGPVDSLSIEAMFPFGNQVVSLKVSGATLLKALNLSLASVGSGEFLQVSGLRLRARAGKWIEILVTKPGGGYTPLDPQKTYTLATNSWLAGGGSGYKMLAEEGRERRTVHPKQAELIKESLRTAGTIGPEVSGRMVIDP